MLVDAIEAGLLEAGVDFRVEKTGPMQIQNRRLFNLTSLKKKWRSVQKALELGYTYDSMRSFRRTTDSCFDYGAMAQS